MRSGEPVITHPGIIQSVGENKICIKILSQPACSKCHAKGMCSVAGMQEKIVEVPYLPDNKYKAGDEVIIYMEKTMGNKAVLYAYFLPFVILLTTLIVMLSIFHNEAVAGLTSLAILIPYYFILFLQRDKIKKKFTFRIYS
jgi:sigma-E factor negative regulatory protein RseC